MNTNTPSCFSSNLKQFYLLVSIWSGSVNMGKTHDWLLKTSFGHEMVSYGRNWIHQNLKYYEGASILWNLKEIS